MQKYVKKEKRYRLINFICLLAVYKKLIGTGRVLGTRILRYDLFPILVLRASAITMPEFVEINLVSDDDNSLTDRK